MSVPASPTRVLLLDHLSASLRGLIASLEREGYAVAQTDEPDQALAWLREGACEVVLGELSLAAETLLTELARSPAAPPLIVFDDFAALDAEAPALRAAAFEALARPLPDAEVVRAVKRALESQALRHQN